ncbi:unnamed protein product [Nesidiocoris tenuis]|uniref:Uncharacterized protein n=1 Tax=Nesidiocoris tenuis TaxID=355587 RepID=A0A6H5GTP6_9HEMI|nr:unnamed protein product [Nesidiocoris tenuis]
MDRFFGTFATMRDMHEKRNPFFPPERCCLGCENDVVMVYNETSGASPSRCHLYNTRPSGWQSLVPTYFLLKFFSNWKCFCYVTRYQKDDFNRLPFIVKNKYLDKKNTPRDTLEVSSQHEVRKVAHCETLLYLSARPLPDGRFVRASRSTRSFWNYLMENPFLDKTSTLALVRTR